MTDNAEKSTQQSESTPAANEQASILSPETATPPQKKLNSILATLRKIFFNGSESNTVSEDELLVKDRAPRSEESSVVIGPTLAELLDKAQKPHSETPSAPRPKRFVIPRVEITAEVMCVMAQEVIDNAHQETSWGLYGIRDSRDQVVICGVLLPDHTVRRSVGNTIFGSPSYGEEIRWLKASYEFRKKHGLVPADTELEFLFKGHSHHTLGLRRYSPTDIASIKDAVSSGLRIAIGPLANIDRLDRKADIRSSGDRGALTIQTGNSVTFHFYYLSQMMVENGIREPVLIQPHIRNDNSVTPPPSCWKFRKADLFSRQISRLASHGCTVTEQWAGQKDGSLRIVLKLTHPHWAGELKISTPHNFPDSATEITLPDGQKQLFEPISGAANPGQQFDLLDIVVELEREGALYDHAVVSDSGNPGPKPS